MQKNIWETCMYGIFLLGCVKSGHSYEGEYLGCYIDKGSDRALKTRGSKFRTGDIIEQCIRQCRVVYYMTYAGVQFGAECWCSDRHDYGRHGEDTSGGCNKPCDTDTSKTCGGTNRVDVYTTCQRGSYTSKPGWNCNYRCHCQNQDICDFESGHCPYGCENLWTGNSCEFRDCSRNNGGCSHMCTPRRRSTYCACRAGYTQPTNDRTRCDDINECDTNSRVSISRDCHTCVNTPGSYRCRCKAGFTLSSDAKRCIDNNECSSNPCAHRCDNTPGSYRCLCLKGYKVKNVHKCEDIDECGGEDGVTISPSCHTCTNTMGSYTCTCRDGYQLSGSECKDINECQENNICDYKCQNTEGSYQCLCQSGFKLINKRQCKDIDECNGENGVTKSPSCHTCTNTAGSYTCTCREGFELSQTQCIDIDECAKQMDGCNHNCENTIGSYECKCNKGFELVNKKTCRDVDECFTLHHTCQNCTNTVGSYHCDCYTGYENVGNTQCEDIDECAIGNGGCNYTCKNTPGSFYCTCLIGYQFNASSMECEDCQAGSYGENCSKECHCASIEACNHVNGTCSDGLCRSGWKGASCAEAVSTSTPASLVSGIAVGVVLAVLVAVLVILLIVFILRRKRKNGANDKLEEEKLSSHSSETGFTNAAAVLPPKAEETQEEQPCVNAAGASSPSLDAVSVASSALTIDGIYDEPILPPEEHSEFIKVVDLEEHVKQEKQDRDAAKKKFDAIPKKTAESTYAGQPDLRLKNRFKNILPYDHNRVHLEAGDTPLSDYINASYVGGYYNNEVFIASHGPSPHTIDDFWRMIWEQNVCLIVMVTNLVEDGKRKCEQYWPEEDPKIFGDLTITSESESVRADFTVRVLRVTKDGENSPGRKVTQYHFTTWPDHGVPSNSTHLLRFYRKIREAMDPNVATLVHCSAGVGRTGTFLGLDWLLHQAEAKGGVDVYGCVHMLRRIRMQMVQTLDQYLFLHTALLEALTLGDTSMTVEEFRTQDPAMQATIQDRQFSTLEARCPPLTTVDQKKALHKENKIKNRSNILPGDDHRVHLMSSWAKRSDYINAVYVPSYRKKNGYIATQWPLEDTVIDFWRMVSDYDIETVVMVEDLSEKEGYCPLLPAKELDYKKMGVIHNGTNTAGHVTEHMLTVWKGKMPQSENVYMNTEETRDDNCNRVRVLQLASPETLRCAGILELNKALRVQAMDNSPTVVVCNDGASVCGLYMAASSLMDMVDTEGEVDAFYTVLQVKTVRPEFISTQEQFKQLHEITQEYIHANK